MQLDFYRNKLAEKGIETIIPANADDVEFINNAIYEEMGKGLFLPETKERVINMIHALAAQGAQGVILGCTEIPILIKQEDSPIPVFDTTTIHVNASVEFAVGGGEKVHCPWKENVWCLLHAKHQGSVNRRVAINRIGL